MPPLSEGMFLRRYKRFFADIDTPEGVITAHNPNTGSMRALIGAACPALYSVSDNPDRKLPYTLEGLFVSGEWILTNTVRVNAIVADAFATGRLKPFGEIASVRREVTFHDSRFDFALTLASGSTAFVEVKSVTLFDDEYAMFPDAVTERGAKHLAALERAVSEGYIAAVLYLVQVNRRKFRTADEIDPAYGAAFRRAVQGGVTPLAAYARFDRESESVQVEQLTDIL